MPDPAPAGPLSPETLAILLDRASRSPSPYGLQPGRFLVVEDPAGLRRLQACAWGRPEFGRARAAVVVLGYHHPERTHLEAMLEAQVAAGVWSPSQAAEVRGRARSGLRDESDRELWAARSAMLAAGEFLSAAASQGLSAVLADRFDAEAVRREFGVPDDHAVAALVAITDAAEAGTGFVPFGLDEVCFSEHFGRPWTP